MNSSYTSQSTISPPWDLKEHIALALLIDITNILAEFSWVYNTRNTEIFVHDVLEKIPNQWVEVILLLSVEEFKQLPLGFTKDNWPPSLKAFVLQCARLAEIRFSKCIAEPEQIESKKSKHIFEKNVPLKKQHEIVAMSHLVYQICKDVKCYKVLDIGSGLGYLDQLLHQNFGLQCVGLDSAKKITEGAKCRLKDPCTHSIHYETMIVQNNKDCIEKLQIVLKNVHNANTACDCKNSHFSQDFINDSDSTSFVMVGLHCCGNLMQDMMKLFCCMKELKAFLCIGCCYNKINIDDFPMSQAVQNAIHSVHKIYPQWYPCVSGLRLGSHATRADCNDLNSKSLQDSETSLIYRAILEYYIIKENINWRKPKRRVRISDLTDFETYCDTMFQNEETSSNLDRNERMKKLSEIYSMKESLFPRVRVLLILQILLQPLWECFVILDRKFYFKEKSIASDVYTVWDECMSARNIALCAYKN